MPTRSSAASASRVLGVFAKEPVPGRVKTRLAADTSPEWAAAVARAFLVDTLRRLANVNARRVVAFAPREAEGFFGSIAGPAFERIPQSEGDLGRRMSDFCATQLHAGARKVVLVGTDSPSLPVAFVEEAFAALDGADVVLGPATDGGYYLLGVRTLPPVFEGLPWGTAEVLGETVARLRSPDWRVRLLPPWYDIDTRDDWRMLRGHLAALQAAGELVDLPATLAVPAFE